LHIKLIFPFYLGLFFCAGQSHAVSATLPTSDKCDQDFGVVTTSSSVMRSGSAFTLGPDIVIDGNSMGSVKNLGR